MILHPLGPGPCAGCCSLAAWLETAQPGECHQDCHGILLTKVLRCHAQLSDPLPILLEVLLVFMGWCRGPNHAGPANQHGHLARLGVGIEVQRNVRVAPDVAEFVPLRLAIDENRRSIPPEPDRPWLGGIPWANRGQPDDLFGLELLGDPPAKLTSEVNVGQGFSPTLGFGATRKPRAGRVEQPAGDTRSATSLGSCRASNRLCNSSGAKKWPMRPASLRLKSS